MLILYQTVIDKMIFFKMSTFYDVSNLPKPSWIKGQIACHCNIIFITLFRIIFFQLTHLFYIIVLFILFTELSYPSHIRLAVLKPMALVSCILSPVIIIMGIIIQEALFHNINKYNSCLKNID